MSHASDSSSVLAVSVGNTRTLIGMVEFGGEVTPGPRQSVSNADSDGILAAARAALDEHAGGSPMVVIASVNDEQADRVQTRIGSELGVEVLRVGRDIDPLMEHTLDDASTVGQDRLMAALGAFARFKSACVVIDAGTAVTVDFIDGHGTFHGGAIAPGLTMMLRALHEHTAALPALAFEAPDPARGVLGKDTKHAMLLGARASVVGLAHYLIDTYAEFYQGYPRVVATGGDAAVLFEKDELIEHILPELPLIGIGEMCKRWAEASEDEG